MINREIKAEFEEFSLPETTQQNISAIIPTFSRTKKSLLGTHCYYFLNFKALKGLCVRIKHKDIIFPGLKRLEQANYKRYSWFKTMV